MAAHWSILLSREDGGEVPAVGPFAESDLGTSGSDPEPFACLRIVVSRLP